MNIFNGFINALPALTIKMMYGYTLCELKASLC